MSDDGRHALTLIAFLGSVFSPYYAAARRRGPADPLAHVAFNVALYGAAGRRWAMTERGRRDLERDREQLRIGRSTLAWRGDTLEVEIDERCVPWPRPLRGHLRVHLGELTGSAFALDAAGRHRWCPIAPAARIEVAFDAPACRWQGHAYLDANAGERPLEQDFIGWQWQRGAGLIHYDVQRRDGSRLALALQAGRDGRLTPIDAAPATALPRSGWGIERQARGPLALAQTLEDGPFYARSLLQHAAGAASVHESLSLDRFSRRWVQALLPFRMPRLA